MAEQRRFSENQGKARSQGNMTKLEGIDFAQFEYPEGATGPQGAPGAERGGGGGKKGGRLHGNPRCVRLYANEHNPIPEVLYCLTFFLIP